MADGAMVCARCGHRNTEKPTFCGSCGSFLEWTAAVDDIDPQAQVSADATASAQRLHEAGALASVAERPDLSKRLTSAAEAVVRPSVPVAVVGQFKVGKSSFVNSVVNAEVCPPDPLVGSVVPTVVHYGTTSTVVIEHGGGDTQKGSLDTIAEWVSERHNAGNRLGIRRVRVEVPRQFLGTGLELIDTPGLGGLDSPAGRLLLGTIASAAGVLVLTAAVQELTLPELDFIKRLHAQKVEMALVVTKIDMTPHWRRIVELDAGHLAHVGIDMPIFPVSSSVRAAAADRRDRDLNEESGYPNVLRWLADIASRRADHAARRADLQLRDATAQMRVAASVAEQVAAEPERAEPVMAQLEAVATASVAFAAPDADWRAVLRDGAAEVRAEADQDLKQRIQQLTERVDELIASADAAGSWPEVEAWARRELTDECVLVMSDMAERFGDLAGRIDAVVEGQTTVASAESFPTIGSLAASLMVGSVGQTLVMPVTTPDELRDAETGEPVRQEAARAAAHQLAAGVMPGMQTALDRAIDDVIASVEASVEAQGAELVSAAEATIALTVAATAPPESTDPSKPESLSLADLRRQLEGLDAAAGAAS